MTPSQTPRERVVLRDLIAAIEQFIVAMDDTMRGPSTPERGKDIARLLNGLEMAKDRARFSADGLNIDFRTGRVRVTPAATRRSPQMNARRTNETADVRSASAGPAHEGNVGDLATEQPNRPRSGS